MSTRRHVLITGGSSGIGLGLARRLHSRGDRVTITGRSSERLARVAEELPGTRFITGDLALATDRELLASAVADDLDVLINNAGIQRRVALAAEDAPWEERQKEIDLLLAAPIHLTGLLVPAMLQRGGAATVVNVTSGGAFIPQPFAPVYSAAKAALHSFTLNLRLALEDTSVRVVEVIPPAVATGLSGLEHPHGADVDVFCDTVMAGLDSGALEVGYGPTATPELRARLDADRAAIASAAQRFPVERFR